MKKQISSKIVSLIFAILVICFAITFYAFSWTGPTALPPDDNVDPPINVGGTGQYKSGSLGIGGAFHAYSNAIINGNVGIGTSAPLTKLEIKGGKTKTTGGLIIQLVGSQAEENAMFKDTGQMWLRTDI